MLTERLFEIEYPGPFFEEGKFFPPFCVGGSSEKPDRAPAEKKRSRLCFFRKHRGIIQWTTGFLVRIPEKAGMAFS